MTVRIEARRNELESMPPAKLRTLPPYGEGTSPPVHKARMIQAILEREFGVAEVHSAFGSIQLGQLQATRESLAKLTKEERILLHDAMKGGNTVKINAHLSIPAEIDMNANSSQRIDSLDAEPTARNQWAGNEVQQIVDRLEWR